ncbi:MAG TPA: CRTAC1 family protein [Candidatus Polarisedimenticolia bacterium]|nr:CRTAC1 family protein [Candidatus Polarisedimenticolia bacterium]
MEGPGWRLLLAGACLALAAAPGTRVGAPAGPAPAPDRISFSDVAAAAGLDFTHFNGGTGEFLFPEIMGSGGALFDYDGDGDLDVFLVQGALLDPGKKPADALFPPKGSQPAGSRLLRNELIAGAGGAGPLRFTDVTAGSGAGVSAYGMGAATGDYDNDGDVDLYITAYGPDVLLSNNGDGTFRDATAASGLGDPRWNSSAAFFDFDRDGWLDLYVAAYADFTLATHKECFTPSGARDYCNPRVYPGLPGRLYRNRGDGVFQDITGASGLDTAYGHALGVVAGDFDGNGWDDLYVANDGDANQLWMNEKGRFTETALLSGAALDEHGQPEAGMGIAAGDIDDDGDTDLFLTHLKGETNTLYENRGDATFEETTARRGLAQPSLPFTGFGVGWVDFDHDGDSDLIIANGDVTRVEALAGQPYPYHQTNQIMMNVGGGRFEDRSKDAGAVMALSEVTRGVALGDVDNDGDVDVLITNNCGPARLLRNDLEPRRNWMQLRVLDKAARRDAIGARVTLTLSDGRRQTRWIRTDGSYLSASAPRAHFSWPEGKTPRRLEVALSGRPAVMIEEIPAGRISTVAP